MAINLISGFSKAKNIYSSLPGKTSSRKETASKPAMSVREFEHEQRKADNNNSVVDQSLTYADQLRASRYKAKNTSLEKKKLQYNFKRISSQIIRSKTSATARKAVQAARHEVMRLKRLQNNDNYDETEVQLALDHAKAMEKVAKKKVLHLEQEEMIERNGKGTAVEFDEIKEEKDNKENKEAEELSEEELAEDFEENESEEEEMTYEVLSEDLAAEISEEYYSEMEAVIEDTMQELEDALSETMDELVEGANAPDPNMSAESLKKLKIRHRGKELKEIAEADKKYLKGLMEHEKAKQAGGNAIPTGGSVSMPSSSAQPAPVINIPPVYGGSGGESAASGGGFNLCV